LNIDDSRNYCEFKNNPGIYGCWSLNGISPDCDDYSSNDWHTCFDLNNYPSAYLICSRDPGRWGEQNFNQYDYLNSQQQIYQDNMWDQTVCWYKFARDDRVESLNISLINMVEGQVHLFTEQDAYQYVNQGSLSYSGNQIFLDLHQPKDVYVLFIPNDETGFTSLIQFSIYAEKKKETTEDHTSEDQTSEDHTWMITIISVILFTCWCLILTGILMIYLGCWKTTKIIHLVEVDDSKDIKINCNKSNTNKDKDNLEEEMKEIQVPKDHLPPITMTKSTPNKFEEVLPIWS